jgi:hypothetical protein
MAAVVPLSVPGRQARRNPQETDSVQSIVGPRSAFQRRPWKPLRVRWLWVCSLVQIRRWLGADHDTLRLRTANLPDLLDSTGTSPYRGSSTLNPPTNNCSRH